MSTSNHLKFIADVLTVAGDKVLEISREDRVDTAAKGQHDVVSAMDHASTKHIISCIRERMDWSGRMAVICEETDDPYPDILPDDCWIVDPLDGSVIASHGFDDYAISIALRLNGLVAFGGVYQPARGVMVLAERGKQTQIVEKGQPRPVRLDANMELDDNLIAHEVGLSANEDLALNVWMPLTQNCQLVPRVCSSVADAIYLLEGKIAATVNVAGASVWDLAVIGLAVEGAGGAVRMLHQACHVSYIPQDYILAANEQIADEIVELISGWQGTGRGN